MNHWIYALRRLLYVIPVLLGVCFIVFILFNIVSPDPAIMMLGKHASQNQILEIRHELGLDKTYIEQYFDVIKSVFMFEFGKSWATRELIDDMILDGLIPSLSLTIPAFIVSTFLALLFALIAAGKRGKVHDRIILFICIILMSVSALSYILFSQWFFAYKLGWFEISGYRYGFPDFVPYVILPMIIWIFLSIGPDVRLYRTIILDQANQDYIRTARAKGVSEPVIFYKHILKNSFVPILTYLLVQVPYLILGALLLESFFGIPGLGSIIIDAINASDFPVLKAMTILMAALYILFNLITDILCTIIDPRIRYK